MGILNKMVRGVIFHCTSKPKHYVHVDKPKTLQDYRQVQYNNWCKAKGVYNGSYLPKDPNKLTDAGKKGWVETTASKNTSGNRNFMRKSSRQIVRFDPESDSQIAHYHWTNPNPTIRGYRLRTKYLDRYGKPCTDRDDSHHLAPLDKDCPRQARKRYRK